jgi:murein tripeptide amidase MpaA
VNGFATVRLTGDEANDWDAALFDRRSGRRLDASSAPGANEVLQTAVRQGQALDIQVCRLRGSAGREPLTVSPVIAPLRPKAAAAPRQSLVSIRIAHRSDVARLESLGLNLDEAPTHGHATAVLGSGQAASLAAAGYRYRTLIPDMARAERGYRAQERASAHAAAAHGSALPSGRTTYRHYPDIQADLKRIVKGHPKLARSIVLPRKSFQGRDIQGIEVTAGAGSPHDGKPVFFLMGAHHAREWPSAEIPVEFGMYLTRQYGHNARVTHLLRHVRVVIVPVINPDGYITSREAFDPADQSGDPAMAPSLAESVAPPFGGTEAYRRKNCDGASPSPNTPCSAQQGVDPNRNYGEHWGGPGAGTDPGDQDYRGTDQWSEPETQAVHAFSQNHDITTLVTMHNFASLVLRPPGVHNDGLAPDEPALKRLGDRMAADTGYTSEYSFQLYDTSGTTEDWNYAAAGTYGYTIEMGPSADRGGNFHVAYQRAVINQWTGSESEKGKGKGLRDALLAAGEEATDRHQFSTLVGSAPRYSVLRLRKDFRTYSSEICTVEDTDVPCTAQGATLPRRSQADHLEYTAVLRRPGGHFRWIVSPSTRPFVLKAHHQEKWNLTCRAPGSSKVEKRQITVDRGQTLVLDLKCGRP